MLTALRIITALGVVAALSLYLYDDGAHRVYDIILSAVVIIVTSPVAAVLAVVSKIKNKRVFYRDGEALRFSAPNNALNKIPFFYLVFIGGKNILPTKLGRKKAVSENS